MHKSVMYELDDEGRHVFTRTYLLSRGECCHNGCRNCPYGFQASISSDGDSRPVADITRETGKSFNRQESGPLPGVGEAFFCSWSGGKDSCLALYRAIRAGAVPACLVTMLIEEGGRSRSHGLAIRVIEEQAAAIGVPLLTVCSSWADYEDRLISALCQIRSLGIRNGVFGDIDIDRHRLWEEKVCAAAGMKAYLPLWKSARLDILQEALTAGFEARVVAVNAEQLGPQFLGRWVNQTLIDELQELGVDACGENGEYHTVVTSGPIFRQAVCLEAKGKLLRSGYWFLDYQVCG